MSQATHQPEQFGRPGTKEQCEIAVLRSRIPPFEGGFPSVFTQHRDRARVERKLHA